MIVTEAIYDVRESHNCAWTFETHFTQCISDNMTVGDQQTDLTFNHHPPPPRRLGTEHIQCPVDDENGQEAVDRGPSLELMKQTEWNGC